MKPFTILFTNEARERIRRLHPTIKREIRAAIDDLKANPWEGKILQRELLGLLSLPVKNYRILYQIDEEKEIIHILTIGIRKTIYKEVAKK